MTTYTKETALYDTGAIAGDIQEAGAQVSKYITAIGDEGIKVHPYDATQGQADTDNYAKIDAEGMEIWQKPEGTDASVKVAEFGSDGAQIGQDEKSRVEINADSFVAYNDESIPFFNVDYDGGELVIKSSRVISSANSTAQTSYIQKGASDKHIGIVDDNYRILGLDNKYSFKDFKYKVRIQSNKTNSYYITPINPTTDGLKCESFTTTPLLVNITEDSYVYEDVVICCADDSPFPDIVRGETESTTINKSITFRVVRKSDHVKVGTVEFQVVYTYKPDVGDLVRIRIFTVLTYDSGVNSYSFVTPSRRTTLSYIGTKTTHTTAPALTFGSRSSIDNAGGFSSVLGKDLIANYEAQHIIGKYNDNQIDTAFEIGNGNGITDDPKERSNALTVDWDGNITAAGGVIVNKTDTTKKDLTYVNEYVRLSANQTASESAGQLTLSTSNKNCLVANKYDEIWSDYMNECVSVTNGVVTILKSGRYRFDYQVYFYNGFTANDIPVCGIGLNGLNAALLRTSRFKTTVTNPYTTLSGSYTGWGEEGNTFYLIAQNSTAARGVIGLSQYTRLTVTCLMTH